MSFKNKIVPLVTSLINSPKWLTLNRDLRTIRRRVTRSRHVVHYFHDVSDPYSHLTAQCVHDLSRRYDIDFSFHLVSPPVDDMAPERMALQNFSRRDATVLAPFHGFEFVDIGHQPSQAAYDLAVRAIASSALPTRVAFEIGKAYWENNIKMLETFASVSMHEAQGLITKGSALRNDLGHYLGATFYYDGEWYWGVDRLPYLEERLVSSNCRYAGMTSCTYFQEPPEFMSEPVKQRLKVEFFPSLRSPYSYLAMPDMLDLANHYPVDVIWRPVMPMVMRGLPVPSQKGRYIVFDANREAKRIGVPFGHIADPVGRPILRGYSLYPYATEQGLGPEYLHAFCVLAWSEGEDMARDEGLQKAITRAGLDWKKARQHLDNEDWKDQIEKNQSQIFESGLWGVPSFRLLGPRGKVYFDTWGRDRIWLLKHYIQKALADKVKSAS